MADQRTHQQSREEKEPSRNEKLREVLGDMRSGFLEGLDKLEAVLCDGDTPRRDSPEEKGKRGRESPWPKGSHKSDDWANSGPTGVAIVETGVSGQYVKHPSGFVRWTGSNPPAQLFVQVSDRYGTIQNSTTDTINISGSSPFSWSSTKQWGPFNSGSEYTLEAWVTNQAVPTCEVRVSF